MLSLQDHDMYCASNLSTDQVICGSHSYQRCGVAREDFVNTDIWRELGEELVGAQNAIRV